MQGLDDEDAAEQAGLGFLSHLSEAAATALARAVAPGRAGYDELARMAGHLSASTANTLENRREIAARKRVAQRELDAADARLTPAEQGGGPKKVESVEVAVDLEAQADAEAEIELSYHVPGASWRSLYDLVLDGERLGRLLPGRGHPASRRGLARGRARALDRARRPEPDPARAEPLVHRPSAAASPSRRHRPDVGHGRPRRPRAAPTGRASRRGRGVRRPQREEAAAVGQHARGRAGRERVRDGLHGRPSAGGARRLCPVLDSSRIAVHVAQPEIGNGIREGIPMAGLLGQQEEHGGVEDLAARSKGPGTVVTDKVVAPQFCWP